MWIDASGILGLTQNDQNEFINLPIEERRDILLRHTEWVLFKAEMSGVAAEGCCLDATNQVRRIMSGWRDEEAEDKIKRNINRRIEKLQENHQYLISDTDSINELALVLLCKMLLFEVSEIYSYPKVFYLRIGNMWEQSPLAKWFRERGVVTEVAE